MVRHRATGLAAAKAGVWSDIPITIELAGLSAAERNSYNPNDLCVNWEDHHPYQDVRGNWHAIFHAWRGQPTDYPRPVDAFPNYSGCSTNVSWPGKGGYDT